jgi:predicted nucleotide-binding protein
VASKGKAPDHIGEPDIDKQTAINLLVQQIDRAKNLLSQRPLSNDSYSQWGLLTLNFLEKAFGRNSPNVKSVIDVGKYGGFPLNAGEEWWENHRAINLTTQVTHLEGLVELLKTEMQLITGPISVQRSVANLGRRIFLVHGHDEAILHEVARFLEKLEQQITILRELPNKGRTIIEKFEDYADVGFAVVLLTSDDRGGAIDLPYEKQLPRARQNVLLELGYFLGKLSRSRVCALYQEGVEIPSDYTGVLYILLDSDGGWRLKLGKELVAAGFKVDMNKAL